MQNTWKNCKLTHLDIQKDMVNAIAHERSKAIIEDLGNGFFSILVDESRDISVKEQMALILRYVNKQGIIIERFLSIVHVANTTVLSLKCAIEGLLCKHNLSLSRLRGQGYDGANNMQVSNLVTVVGGSCKRRDALRDAQFAKIKEDLENGVRRSGQGLNQETNLKHPGDTRWGSYYGTILNLILMFSAVSDVLEIIEEDGLSDQKLQNFIFDMCNNDLFLELQGVSELAEKLVSTRKHETYPLGYLLVKLALTLPVATATVERSFSAMKYIKNELRNRMGDQWMNDCLVVKVYDLDVVGVIPEELWSLTFLFNLNLSQNYLTGSLSASIGNLTSMQYL
ncbi:uncharacterized protein LOC142615953 [Castanea sativa]|uniref:uncharacterized protein LOC142615953 n=1 Tax=Castanea sativa TaxID=21020 RepID=UPI003F64BC9F